MTDEKVSECFFEKKSCLWHETKNCKACAIGDQYLHPRTNVGLILVIGFILGVGVSLTWNLM